MSMMAERDMGRILLDLSDDVIQRLDDLKVQRNIPRAELLREAVEQYLEIELKIPSPVRWVCGKTAKKTAWNINVSYARSGNDLRICAF